MSEVSCKLPHLMETPMTDSDNKDTTNAPPARYLELQALVASMEADFQKFYNAGNKAAGTRVRGAMQELKTFAQMIRNEVSSIKNEGKADGEKEDA
jgi:hypothetical protein